MKQNKLQSGGAREVIKSYCVQDLDSALLRPPWHDMLLSWLGSFLAILAISGVNQALLPESDLKILIASFGGFLAASASVSSRQPSACYLDSDL